MFRISFVFCAIFIMASTASGQPAEQGPGEFVSYFGRHYLTPTPNHPCASASFNDHDQRVVLCVDSLGRPIEVDPNFVISSPPAPSI
jgi:hypothetical protein